MYVRKKLKLRMSTEKTTLLCREIGREEMSNEWEEALQIEHE